MMQAYLKALPQYLMPKKAITSLCGLCANVQVPAIKNYLIQSFIRHYGVNMKEALLESPASYPSFNDFFIRQLKPHVRPLEHATVVSPVDGVVSEIGEIMDDQLIQAKGHHYTVQDLLGLDADAASEFDGGLYATLYLSPKDYHRIHMPINASLTSMNSIPGKLFSVKPSSVASIPRLFAQNERCATYFDTPVGKMAMVLVGATIVGKIGLRWHGEIKRRKTAEFFDYTNLSPSVTSFSQGDEMGYFKLGSTVILLFADADRVHWLSDWAPGMPIRLGQALAQTSCDQNNTEVFHD